MTTQDLQEQAASPDPAVGLRAAAALRAEPATLRDGTRMLSDLVKLRLMGRKRRLAKREGQ